MTGVRLREEFSGACPSPKIHNERRIKGLRNNQVRNVPSPVPSLCALNVDRLAAHDARVDHVSFTTPDHGHQPFGAQKHVVLPMEEVPGDLPPLQSPRQHRVRRGQCLAPERRNR